MESSAASSTERAAAGSLGKMAAFNAARIEREAERRSDEGYQQLLGRLSRQSVVKHYDAYADIPWDEPEYRIDPEDPRWERSGDDTLGATAWYRAQPQALRARLGLHSIVGHMRVGIEFESVLKRGLLEYATTLPGSSPEFRYAYHEVIEEAQHSLMFNEFIQRSGLDAPGLPPRLQAGARQVASLGRRFPELFFIFVLGGEEPIDHTQRRVLESDRDALHPLIRRVMQIHVTEEARHLCFARELLRRQVPGLSRLKLARLQVAVPVILGQMARLMMQPPHQVIARYGVPREVVDEAFTHNPAHHQSVHESLAKVRSLCEELRIVTPRTVPLWKRLGVWPEGYRISG